MNNNFPWEYHPDLTEERLRIVTALLVDGHHTAVERYDEEAGDNGWTHGCSAFQFSRHRILKAVDSGKHPWLTIIDRSAQLVFKIGVVPIRIYKGTADDPTIRTLRQTHSELQQLGLVFSDHNDGHELVYRFAIDTDSDGSVITVNFVGLHGLVAILNWSVPFDHTLKFSGTIGREASASVDLNAAPIGVRTDRSAGTETPGG